MPRYAWRLGNISNNPAESVDTSGDTGDTYVMSVENPQGSGTVVWGVSPAGTISGTGTLASMTVGAVTTGSTITPAAANLTVVRAGNAGAVTGVILAGGTFGGQQVVVFNEGTGTLSWATDVTSLIANGLANGIEVNSSRLFTWDAGLNRWVTTQWLAVVVNAGAIANNATLTPFGVPVTQIRCQPGAAVTGIIIASGTFDGQIVDVLNESAAANTITFAAVATSHVADGVTTAIAGVTGRRLVWNSVAAQPAWYKVSG